MALLEAKNVIAVCMKKVIFLFLIDFVWLLKLFVVIYCDGCVLFFNHIHMHMFHIINIHTTYSQNNTTN
jgi:hypothetical protein